MNMQDWLEWVGDGVVIAGLWIYGYRSAAIVVAIISFIAAFLIYGDRFLSLW